MTDHKNCIRAYHRCSKAWYAYPRNNISLMIGMYHPEGGSSGEFEIEWTQLTNGPLSAQLKSFEDSWSALFMFKDLLEEMSKIDSEEIQEPEFCLLLYKLGIKDITAYKQQSCL